MVEGADSINHIMNRRVWEGYLIHYTSGRGRLLGPPLGLEKTLHTKTKLKNKNQRLPQ